LQTTAVGTIAHALTEGKAQPFLGSLSTPHQRMSYVAIVKRRLTRSVVRALTSGGQFFFFRRWRYNLKQARGGEPSGGDAGHGSVEVAVCRRRRRNPCWMEGPPGRPTAERPADELRHVTTSLAPVLLPVAEQAALLHGWCPAPARVAGVDNGHGGGGESGQRRARSEARAPRGVTAAAMAEWLGEQRQWRCGRGAELEVRISTDFVCIFLSSFFLNNQHTDLAAHFNGCRACSTSTLASVKTLRSSAM
jgi:hypothetical protein